jgi:hypothetical protein
MIIEQQMIMVDHSKYEYDQPESSLVVCGRELMGLGLGIRKRKQKSQFFVQNHSPIVGGYNISVL